MRYIDDISVFPRSLCSKELITVIPVPIHLTFPTFRLILKIGFYVITEVELGKLNILILKIRHGAVHAGREERTVGRQGDGEGSGAGPSLTALGAIRPCRHGGLGLPASRTGRE